MMKGKIKNLLVFLSTMMVLGVPVNINAANTYKTANINEITIDPIGQLKSQIVLTEKKTLYSDLDVQEEMELVVGQEEKVEYTTDADEVTFTSSNEKVATVDEDGNITAISKGSAYITVATDDYDLDCEVTVYDKPQITIPEELEIVVDESQPINFTTLSDDKKPDIEYSIEDESIIEIDDDYNVTGLKEGTTEVTFTIEDHLGTNEATIEVTVVKEPTLFLLDSNVIKGETKALQVITNSTQEIEYTSSDKTKATVDEDGNVTGVKSGSVTITAKMGDIEADATITVKKSVTASVPQKFEVVKGEHKNLGVTTASTKEITYTTSDPKILTINSNGTIKAKENGTATVTVTIGSKEYTSKVKVTDQITVTAPDKYEVVLDEYKPFTYKSNSVVTPSYTSSDKSIFTVDEYGLIHALKEGKATLTTEIKGVKDECEVSVVKDITLDCKDSIVVVKGEKVSLDYTTNSALSVTCASADRSIATVTADGIVKGKGAGTTEITVNVGDQSKTCKVTVDSSITIDAPTTLTMKVGDKEDLEVTTNSTKSIKYSNNNGNVITVSKKGVVTAKKAGTATVTIKVGSKSVKCKITVEDTTLDFKQNTYNLDVGKQVQLETTTNSDQKITYSSKDESIAKVSSDGLVTAVAAGSTTITAKVDGKTAKCTINVNSAKPTIQILDKNGVTLYVGGTGQLHYSATNQGSNQIKWSSSDSSIISVDNNGSIKCNSAGSVTITATLGEANSSITVNSKAQSSINILENDGVTLYVGDSGQLHYSTTSQDGQTISWGSSNGNIVNVSQSGAITCVAAGTVTISATMGNSKDTVTVISKARPVASSSSGSSGGSGSSAPAASQSSTTVWIPNSGSKYHKYAGCSNMVNPTPVSEQEAISQGYTRCKKCWK